jgi:hypothetical protein
VSDELERLLAQFRAFDELTVCCDLCGEQRPLSRTQPLVSGPEEWLGLACVVCIRELALARFSR